MDSRRNLRFGFLRLANMGRLLFRTNDKHTDNQKKSRSTQPVQVFRIIHEHVDISVNKIPIGRDNKYRKQLLVYQISRQLI